MQTPAVTRAQPGNNAPRHQRSLAARTGRESPCHPRNRAHTNLPRLHGGRSATSNLAARPVWDNVRRLPSARSGQPPYSPACPGLTRAGSLPGHLPRLHPPFGGSRGRRPASVSPWLGRPSAPWTPSSSGARPWSAAPCPCRLSPTRWTRTETAFRTSSNASWRGSSRQNQSLLGVIDGLDADGPLDLQLLHQLPGKRVEQPGLTAGQLRDAAHRLRSKTLPRLGRVLLKQRGHFSFGKGGQGQRFHLDVERARRPEAARVTPARRLVLPHVPKAAQHHGPRRPLGP